MLERPTGPDSEMRACSRIIERRRLVGNALQRDRLAALIADGAHLQGEKGLMIKDADALADLAPLAERLGVSRSDALKQALRREWSSLKAGA